MIKNTKSMFKYAIISVIAFSHVMQIMSMDPQIGGPQSPSVRIGHTYYAGLPEAVTNAKNDDILSILKSMEIDQEIRVEGKNITIQPEGDITLLRGYDYDGHLFYIAKGASLTLRTNLLPISTPDPTLAGTDLLDPNSRLVINGDWKNQFIIGDNGQQVFLDENAPTIPVGHRRRNLSSNCVEFTGQHYVIAEDGRRLYIDGIKRTLLATKVEEYPIYLNRDMAVTPRMQQEIYIDSMLKPFVLGDSAINFFEIVKISVTRSTNSCVIVNNGQLKINGNIVLYNNCNAVNPLVLPKKGGAVINGQVITHADYDQKKVMIMADYQNDCIYENNVTYGTIYNNGSFDMFIGYIQENNSNGIFNSQNAIFNMHGGAIFKNSAYHGGGVLNCNIFNLYDGKIFENIALFHGGGIYNRGILNTLSGHIFKNQTEFKGTFLDCGCKLGGGIYNNEIAKIFMQGVTIYKNCAQNGGGIYNKGLLQITNVSIYQNVALPFYFDRHGVCNKVEQAFFTCHPILSDFVGLGGGIFTFSKNGILNIHISENVAKIGNDFFFAQ